MRTLLLTLTLLFSSLVFAGQLEELEKELPLLGHRNWIVVTDSAYPLQNNPGIRTIVSSADQFETVKKVYALLKEQKHVKPVIHLDAELEYVSQKNAPGIKTYRSELHQLLLNQTVRTLPHESLIAKLDEAGRTFSVVIIKTNGTLPYSSVFFELDCAYWSGTAEQELRRAMTDKKTENQ